jgi:hypothetical protein
MRRLADKGLVRQIESGAYVVTENGIDLIEGRYRHPVDAPDVTVPPLKRYPATPRQSSQEAVGTGAVMRGRKRVDLYLPRPVNAARSQEAAGMARAVRSAVAPYTVEPTTDGCDVIRPWFGSAIWKAEG